MALGGACTYVHRQSWAQRLLMTLIFAWCLPVSSSTPRPQRAISPPLGRLLRPPPRPPLKVPQRSSSGLDLDLDPSLRFC